MEYVEAHHLLMIVVGVKIQMHPMVTRVLLACSLQSFGQNITAVETEQLHLTMMVHFI